MCKEQLTNAARVERRALRLQRQSWHSGDIAASLALALLCYLGNIFSAWK